MNDHGNAQDKLTAAPRWVAHLFLASIRRLLERDQPGVANQRLSCRERGAAAIRC